MLSGLAEVYNYNPGMRNDFESCVSYLIPVDPVVRKISKADPKKRIGGIVSAVLFDTKLKKGKGGSGVELIMLKNIDFHQLSQPQKDEFVAWDATVDGMKSK